MANPTEVGKVAKNLLDPFLEGHVDAESSPLFNCQGAARTALVGQSRPPARWPDAEGEV